MHMMSKKESSSEELWTVKRSRTPTVVLTANGEVHTHEEAQVFVHDLKQFVTVQLLEETPAVLSLGKLCKDHGCSYVGQRSRTTINQKIEKVLSARATILCARVTGKAGENGQHSGEMGGSSPWTRPKALAGHRSIWGGDRPRRRLPGSLSTGSPAGRTPLLKKRRDGSMYSQAYVGAGKSCGRQARALLSVIVGTGKVLAGSGWAR